MQKNTITRIDQLIEFLMQEKETEGLFRERVSFYAIGKNPETIKIHKFFNLTGIIDDASTPGSCWKGIPLIKSVNADKKKCVINCSTSIRPIDTYHYLKKVGFTSIINYSEFLREMKDDCLLPDFVKDQQHEMRHYADAWQEILDNLGDQTSKNMFLDVLKFRMTADPEHMKNYEVRLDEQYFESFMGYKNEIFIDAGGFDGDTVLTQ